MKVSKAVLIFATVYGMTWPTNQTLSGIALSGYVVEVTHTHIQDGGKNDLF